MQNAEIIHRWNAPLAEQYIQLLTGLYLKGFLDDPDGIGNLDESGFKLGEPYVRVFAN